MNDMREGQGSYYYHDKNKLFVGEWVNDQPKTGVYTEVEDDDVFFIFYFFRFKGNTRNHILLTPTPYPKLKS